MIFFLCSVGYLKVHCLIFKSSSIVWVHTLFYFRNSEIVEIYILSLSPFFIWNSTKSKVKYYFRTCATIYRSWNSLKLITPCIFACYSFHYFSFLPCKLDFIYVLYSNFVKFTHILAILFALHLFLHLWLLFWARFSLS